MITPENEIVDFILYLRWESEVEINQWFNTITQLWKILGKPQWFFCCWLWNRLLKRAKDEDIKTKKYFVADFDIRLDHLKKTWHTLTHKELLVEIQKVISILEDNGFNDYSYSVMTWNWLHLYFTWIEKEFTQEVYSTWVSIIFESINNVLKDTPYKTDPVMKNLWRLSRLPGTLNPRKKTKKNKDTKEDVVLFDLWETECYIIKTQKQNSIWFSAIENLAEWKIKEKIKEQSKRENNRFKKTLTIETVDLFEAICKIPVNDLFIEEFGVEQKWKYFYTSWKREWVMYLDSENKIYHWWCSAWSRGKEWRIYDTYHYIMAREWLDKKQTFDWFVKNYSNIAELDKKNKNEYIKSNNKINNGNNKIDKPILKNSYEFIHEEKYFTFWLQAIDKKFGMPQIWDLVLFAWFPWSWKTEYCYSMARKNSEKDKVLYFSLELSSDAMKKRLSRKRAWIWKYQYQTKNYSINQKEIFNKRKKYLDSFDNIKFFNFKKLPPIETIIDTIKANKEHKIVFIDALWNIWGQWDELTRYANVTKKLRLFVRDNNVCIVLAHHMNKPSANESYRPGWLAKLRWTQKIVDDCTLICEVFRDQDPELEDDREKSAVTILQYKDTLDWVTWQQEIYFYKWEYVEEYKNWVF